MQPPVWPPYLVKLNVADLLLLIAGENLGGWFRLAPVPEVEFVEGGDDEQPLHRVERQAGYHSVGHPELRPAMQVPHSHLQSWIVSTFLKRQDMLERFPTCPPRQPLAITPS